ncbi:hypothetical protein KIPE111705_46170 [Kibdelosporangium persicum]
MRTVSRVASRLMRFIVSSMSEGVDRAPIRYSSVEPLMPKSGVRSSWLTSETKVRIRSSDAARPAKASSSWPSMVLSDAARCPISVLGAARPGTRRVRSPSAIAAAVCSMRRSGRRPRPRANQPTVVSRTSSTEPLIMLVARSCAIVASASVSGAAAITVPCQPMVGRATARHRPEPSAACRSTAVPLTGIACSSSRAGKLTLSSRED